MELLRACSVRRSARGTTEQLRAGAAELLRGEAPSRSVVALRAAPWSLRDMLRGRSVVAP